MNRNNAISYLIRGMPPNLLSSWMRFIDRHLTWTHNSCMSLQIHKLCSPFESFLECFSAARPCPLLLLFSFLWWQIELTQCWWHYYRYLSRKRFSSMKQLTLEVRLFHVVLTSVMSCHYGSIWIITILSRKLLIFHS